MARAQPRSRSTRLGCAEAPGAVGALIASRSLSARVCHTDPFPAPLAHRVEPRTFNPVGRVRVPYGASSKALYSWPKPEAARRQDRSQAHCGRRHPERLDSRAPAPSRQSKGPSPVRIRKRPDGRTRRRRSFALQTRTLSLPSGRSRQLDYARSPLHHRAAKYSSRARTALPDGAQSRLARLSPRDR